MTDLQFPGVSMFWELGHNGMLTVALRAPIEYVSQFKIPGDMMYQFLMAVQARGVDVEHTENVRVRYNKHDGTFLIRWSGLVTQNQELVHDVIPALTQQLGIEAHGDA